MTIKILKSTVKILIHVGVVTIIVLAACFGGIGVWGLFEMIPFYMDIHI